MSDFNSSLPVRTENNGDVAAKIVDGTITSQALSVDAAGKIFAKLNDGAGTNITSQTNGAQQALDVGINVAGVQIDPRQIRALTSSDQITAIQGTSPWITKDQSDGPVTPGTVASFSQLAGGQFNTVLPTLTNGQQAALQVDSNGRLLVTTTIVSTDDHNYGTVGANTLRTAAQIGNATGAADFNFGTVGAQTLRTAAEVGNATGAADFNFGAIGAQSLRAAAQIGNSTGAADFNAGATGAQTLRVTANQGTPGIAANGWFVRPTDGTNSQAYTAAGEAKVDITTSITLTTTSTNFPTTVDTNYGTVGANTLRSAAQIGNATGAADFNFGTVGAQTLRVAGQIGNATGAANFNNGATGAQTLRVAANLAVGGADVTSSNPVPVTFDNPGTPINDYKRAIAVAAAASDNHDYTVTAGKTLTLNQVESTASGKAKMEIEIETGVATGVFTTRWTQFNSTATPNMSIRMQDPILVAAGVRVRIVMTNKDVAADDIYSTISGYEI